MLNDGDRILNVPSFRTRFTIARYAAYASIKGAVDVLPHDQAKESGQRNITVATIAFGPIETNVGGGAVRDNSQFNQAIALQTALGRVVLPEHVDCALAMRASSHRGWFTGQRMEAVGGRLLSCVGCGPLASRY